MNSFVNNQTAGEYVAGSKGKKSMREEGKKFATGEKAHATGMSKMMKDHKQAQPMGHKYASGGKCGATK